MITPFSTKLAKIQESTGSMVCVGLDPDLDRIPDAISTGRDPANAIGSFIRQIIDATYQYASAYKINFAFFEALGEAGYRVLSETRAAIPNDRIVIADAKRGDIGNTARFYAKSVFDELMFDAITVSPYMGRDSVTPFLSYEGTAVYVLVRTSNPGSADLQLATTEGGEQVFQRIGRLAHSWGAETPGEVGFVTGATDTKSLTQLRTTFPETPLLIPGVGAQGGDANAVMMALRPGTAPALINSSRSILYASNGPDFATAAGNATRSLRELLRP